MDNKESHIATAVAECLAVAGLLVATDDGAVQLSLLPYRAEGNTLLATRDGVEFVVTVTVARRG